MGLLYSWSVLKTPWFMLLKCMGGQAPHIQAWQNLQVPLEYGRILTEEDFERIRKLRHRKMVEAVMRKHGLKSAAKRERLMAEAEDEAEEAMAEQVTCCLSVCVTCYGITVTVAILSFWMDSQCNCMRRSCGYGFVSIIQCQAAECLLCATRLGLKMQGVKVPCKIELHVSFGINPCNSRNQAHKIGCERASAVTRQSQCCATLVVPHPWPAH